MQRALEHLLSHLLDSSLPATCRFMHRPVELGVISQAGSAHTTLPNLDKVPAEGTPGRDSRSRPRNWMINQTLVIVTGLVLAAAGHILVHNFLGAARAWVRADEQFPPVM